MARGDSLKTYRKKRDFSVTPEPPSTAKVRRTALGAARFMVHKHDATRLHYDVRLEMDGVLASWACPKGPSYDPAQKRLAVETEDHPLAYGDFEGRIPDGEYGAGDSIIWDRGTYDTVPPGQASAQRKKGHLHLVFQGQKLEGGWHLLRTRPQGGKPQWLLFKAKDERADAAHDVVAERPESVVSGRRLTRGPERASALRGPHPAPEVLLQRVWPPMLAVLAAEGTEAPPSEYIYEVKYDGFRGLAAISGGQLAVKSRNDLDLTARFPFLREALRSVVVGEAVLDGEIIALDSSGVSRFQLLGDASAEHRFLVFDLLWLDGQDLRSRPLEDRRELLDSVMANTAPPLDLARRVRSTQEEALERARKDAWEGVIAKRRGSLYASARSQDWLKLKVHGTDELTIAGYTPISNGAKEIGALLVARRQGGDFVYAGKVGTGFDHKTRVSLWSALEADRVDAPKILEAPRMREARWVRPRLVAQLRFTEWTRDGRLRHPSFQGLREDKAPAEIGEDVQPAARSARKPAAKARSRKPTTAARSRREPSTEDAGLFGAPGPAHFGTWHSNRAPESALPTARPPLPAPVEVPITHPERVVFPKSGITKADVGAYYDAVAPPLLAALAGRPLSMQQWPRGIAAQGFFRQDAGRAPDWVTRVTVAHEDHPLEHVLVDRPETLAWLANQSALTLHMTSSRAATVDAPDWVAFDFDPAGAGWEQLVPLAQALHGLLEELRLTSVPKTSGKRGLHVFVPLGPGHTHAQALAFAEATTQTLAQRFPELGTVERSLKKRAGRLYLDAEQNGRLKTMVAPYSLRAVEGAPVSTPLHWDEVEARLDPARFTLRTVPKRLAAEGDLFAPVLRGTQTLPEVRT